MKIILMYMVFFNQQISVLVCIVAGYTGPYGLYWAAVGCSGLYWAVLGWRSDFLLLSLSQDIIVSRKLSLVIFQNLISQDVKAEMTYAENLRILWSWDQKQMKTLLTEILQDQFCLKTFCKFQHLNISRNICQTWLF